VRIDPTAAVAPSRIEQGIAAALPEGEPLPSIVRLDADLAAPVTQPLGSGKQ
jgi:hypothetical protein